MAALLMMATVLFTLPRAKRISQFREGWEALQMLNPVFVICVYGFCIYEWDSTLKIEEDCHLQYQQITQDATLTTYDNLFGSSSEFHYGCRRRVNMMVNVQKICINEQ